MPETTEAVRVNWGALLEQIRRDYETPPAKGITHGLQKEAIQNGWGARAGKRNWGFEFRLVAGPHGESLLTMRDLGTAGLTGSIDFDASGLMEGESFPSEERLGRFESMFESGDQTGPGLFGRGKQIFNAASAKHLIYYDSLTIGGNYRFGMRLIKGRKYEQFNKALEGNPAIHELQARTGLPPLDTPGTRITIVDPLPEVVSAVSSGELACAVSETWWELLVKYQAKITIESPGASVVTVTAPAEFGSLPTVNGKGWSVHFRENIGVDILGHHYRIKRLHLLLTPKDRPLPLDLRGVTVNRRGMKVGEIRISNIPPEIEDRFFGYVLLEPALEDVVADIENTTHYGFSSLHKAPYKALRQAAQTETDLFMERLGYKRSATAAEKTKKLAEDAQSELNSILNEMGVPGFGPGKETTEDLLVSVENLRFPRDSNYVRPGDKISGFFFRIVNQSKEPVAFDAVVQTYHRDFGVIDVLLAKKRIHLGPTLEYKTPPFTILIKTPKYPRHEKVACYCELTSKQGQVIEKKTFYFYIDEEPQPDDYYAELRLKDAIWPRKDSRRVDFNESVHDLRYELENVTAHELKARIRVRTLWARESNREIEEVHKEDFLLSPFQTVSIIVRKLTISQELYQEMDRAKVNLRCHAVAMANGPKWERGDRLAEHTVPMYINVDPGYGFFEDPGTSEGGPDAPRSEARPVEGSRAWRLILNTTHPAYLSTEQEEDRRKDYIFEEMAKQTVFVLLRTGQTETLRKQAKLGKADDVSSFADYEVLEKLGFRITDRVLAAYYGT